MNEELTTRIVIEGDKGKGGGSGRTAQEAPNTLRSTAVVKVVEVVSEGEIEGLVGGAQGIYLNDTPMMNNAGGFNFHGVSYDYRVGLPDQPYMPGFPAVEAEVSVATPVTVATPLTRSVTTGAIDAVRVSIQLPNGLSHQDTSNGDMNGSSVMFAIDHRLTSGGTWFQVGVYEISGKTMQATEKQYLVNRPAESMGLGLWEIRVRRLTADSTTSALRNATTVSRITEIQNIKMEYANTAYVGIAVDAEAVGSQIPRRAYLIKGIRCKVPTNYDPETREYTGIWNGVFKTAWTDNPAWVLYDLLTHPRYGLGEFISESQVDKFSFYDAAVYNDQLVPDGNGGQEPRFTFNAVLASRDESVRILSLVASAMRGSMLYAEGQVRLLQDRPADPVKLVTNANVIDGRFDYRSSGLLERHTAFNVTFNDRADRYLQRVSTIDASTATGAFKTQLELAEARYGYNSTEILAVGATTEGQAIRAGMWAVDTVLNQTEIVQFKMSHNGFDLMPGDVLTLWDQDYTTEMGGGRIKSVVGTTVVLDRAVPIINGSFIDVILADGSAIERRSIVEMTGDLSTITVSEEFSQDVLEDAVYIVHGAVSPRQFRVIGIRQDEDSTVALEAVFHDPNKYSRIEFGLNIPPPVFSAAPVVVCNAPTGLMFREIQVNDADFGIAGIRRTLLTSWIAPTQGIVRNYVVRYRVGLGSWTTVETTAPAYEIPALAGGQYEVQVFAMSIQGNMGPEVTGLYTINTGGGGASILNAPTLLQVIGGGSTFTGLDLNIQFTNPASNALVLDATLRDFEVRLIETDGSTTIRTVYVPAVAAGQFQTYSYTYNMNIADGGPRRTVQVQVRCRDASNNLSDPITVTFNNPVPAALADLTSESGIGNIKISFTKPTESDVVGALLWRSTSPGFTPAADNLLYETADNYFSDQVSAGTTYYYRAAAFDNFSKPLDGAGLNISPQFSNASTAGAGIPEVDELPDPVGYTGPSIVYLSTDGLLYTFVDGEWVLTIPDVTEVADGSITTPKLAALSVIAAKIAANAIEADKIAANAVTTDKMIANAVTADKIATDAVTANKVAANAITTDKLDANAVTANKVAANAITTDKLDANAVTAVKIAANAVTADKISVTSLSAVTANVGLLRTASSGARMEIESNVIRVYDASSVLRVRLGNLL